MVQHAHAGTVAPADARRSAAADSPGFAHSAAAAGFWRSIDVRSVDLKQTVWSDGRSEVVRSVDLKQTV